MRVFVPGPLAARRGPVLNFMRGALRILDFALVYHR